MYIFYVSGQPRFVSDTVYTLSGSSFCEGARKSMLAGEPLPRRVYTLSAWSQAARFFFAHNHSSFPPAPAFFAKILKNLRQSFDRSELLPAPPPSRQVFSFLSLSPDVIRLFLLRILPDYPAFICSCSTSSCAREFLSRYARMIFSASGLLSLLAPHGPVRTYLRWRFQRVCSKKQGVFLHMSKNLCTFAAASLIFLLQAVMKTLNNI